MVYKILAAAGILASFFLISPATALAQCAPGENPQWVDVGCGALGCSVAQMGQVESCMPSGSPTGRARCVSSASCIPLSPPNVTIPTAVCTEGIVPCGPGKPVTFCQLCHVPILANNLIRFLFICLIPPIALVAIVGAAITMLVSGGNPGLLSRTKEILKNVIIGIAVAYGAWLLVSAFLAIIGAANAGNWFQLNINCS